MLEYIGIGVAQYCSIFLKAFQQQNVTHERYAWVLPTSFMLAFFELGVILAAVKLGTIWAFLSLGIGAGLGTISAMKFHRWLRKERAEFQLGK